MERTYMKDIALTAAYLTGVKRYFLDTQYKPESDELLKKLDACPETRNIRSLCKIRNTLMLSFKKVDDFIKYSMKNLNSISLFSADDISQLEKNGIPVIKANQRAMGYIMDMNRLIANNIDKCRVFFPQWIEWAYVKKLFIMPNGQNDAKIKSEFIKYIASIDLYPYQTYINWEPVSCGNLFINDSKFLNLLYQFNGQVFSEGEKVLDASDKVKSNIYSFINASDGTVIAVDCENSDVYKLYSVLKNLNPAELSKVKKIILYDDIHTTNAWKLLERFTALEVEYIEVERVSGNKSLVDIRMTAGLCREFYSEAVRSFILVSSDSDYWGLISSLPDAEFLVMIEDEKCGTPIKEAMKRNNIYYCSIDNFCSGNIAELKETALLNELEKELSGLLALNVDQLTEALYRSCRIQAGETEKKKFRERYLQTLKLSINQEGNYYIKIN
ncbi:MAG: NYN domain-containing protein [Oscillospiraceae bacterium]